MTISDPIERMLQAGLQVSPVSPEYLVRITKRLRSGVDVPHIRYCTVEPPQPSAITASPISEGISKTELGLTISWSFESDSWIVAVVGGHGGMAPDDFICSFPSFDVVTEVVLDYYFGVPTIIDGWIVPLHRHPELEQARVRSTISQAVAITQISFDKIQAKLRDEAKTRFQSSDWERALAGSFLQFRHQTEMHITCALLRNSEQAYIIKE